MNLRSALALIILTIAAEGLQRFLEVPDFLLPLPSQVFVTLWEARNDLWLALKDTGTHALMGLAMSFFGATLLAVLISLSNWLRAAILPLALFFQTVPIIAIAPMLVIWFGFGSPTVIASATIVSFFPILASTLQGLESTPRSALELFQLYRAPLWSLYTKLKIPNAAPFIYSGIRISMGLAVVGTLVGEFIGGGGLGSVIDAARTQQRTDLVFAAVLASCFLGWVLTFALEVTKNNFLKKWLVS
jgi:NitT/TauT family transport system permease protein